MSAAVETLRGLLRAAGFEVTRYSRYPLDFESELIELFDKIRPYTMTSPAKIYALCKAVDYLVANQIKGDIVECGVWRGGSMMLVAGRLKQLEDCARDIWLYDTFEGMTSPTNADVDARGNSATERFSQKLTADGKSGWWSTSLREVQMNLALMDYPEGKLHWVKGPVQETLPATMPSSIALLRLDTDWYESTKHELEHLFPLLVPNGVVILDDYGLWKGSKKAADEYFAGVPNPILLNRIDNSARIATIPSS